MDSGENDCFGGRLLVNFMLRRAIMMPMVTFLVVLSLPMVSAMSVQEKFALREDVRQMFYHAYDNYMRYAFPHDELKPLSRTYTDSLGELGNLKAWQLMETWGITGCFCTHYCRELSIGNKLEVLMEHLSKSYNGTALTLVESLSSLAVIGNSSEFERAVNWLGENLSFDIDVRVNVFECNIRLLGGLISAHLLALDSKKSLMVGGYKGKLLELAENLGHRLLPAFSSPTGIPYAWINLKHGVRTDETTETSTSGCGTLILEFGALSRLTGDPQFENAALGALRKLWSMRSKLDLVGTTLDVKTGRWIEHSTGIGAGVDSFYEYLIKAHVLFGGDEYWDMFQDAYLAVQRHFRHGPWYHDADMRTGGPTNWQLTSLQAFWPAVQVLIGDIASANSSHREFFEIWQKFGVLPERYLIDREMIHPTEQYYPLRPELAESTFFLYQATKDPWYLKVGEYLVNSLNVYTRVSGGFASVRNVLSMELEDHQHSFFLSETCKYLYLLFDDTFLEGNNYVFSTEGHPLPVLRSWQQWEPSSAFLCSTERKKERSKSGYIGRNALTSQTCPNLQSSWGMNCSSIVESACHIPDKQFNHQCTVDSDCGLDAISCGKRSCSAAGFCGTWY